MAALIATLSEVNVGLINVLMHLLELDSSTRAHSQQLKLTLWLISKGVNNCLSTFEIHMSTEQYRVNTEITYFLHPAEDAEFTHSKPLSIEVIYTSHIFNVPKGSRRSVFLCMSQDS